MNAGPISQSGRQERGNGSEEATCPVCSAAVASPAEHRGRVHSRAEWEGAILEAKNSGMSDLRIGRTFGISFNALSRLLTASRGTVQFGSAARRKITGIDPKDFEEERTTLWSFRDRGRWATHSNSYRGNWSPYIPRNLIRKYTKKGDAVLDCFLGSGTTAVESLLLGRNFTGVDINRLAVDIARQNVDDTARYLEERGISKHAEVTLRKGDARRLTGVPKSTIDLVCAHPPYAGIIRYSSGENGDLSSLQNDEYVHEMRRVAEESLRVLKSRGVCSLLLGDKRKERKIVPLAFETISAYAESGFDLKELVIKRQFNTRTSGLWYNKAVAGRFLLLAHEYLPVFIKGSKLRRLMGEEVDPIGFDIWSTRMKGTSQVPGGHITSVWSGGAEEMGKGLSWLAGGGSVARLGSSGERRLGKGVEGTVLLDLGAAGKGAAGAARFRGMLRHAADMLSEKLNNGGLMGIRVTDTRVSGQICPMALLAWNDMKSRQDFRIREIVVADGVASSGGQSPGALQIAHEYLLVYEKA